MGHDLRTPLVGIINGSGLLEDTNLTEYQQSLVELIKENGEILLMLCNDITDISKFENNIFNLELSVFNINECIESTIRMVKQQAFEKGITIKFISNLSILVKSDYLRIK